MRNIGMILAVLCALAVSFPAPARAEEITPERRAQLERARGLVEQGLQALADGRADDAVDLLQQSRSAAPDAAIPTYDYALALAAAGRRDDALAAYKDALASAPPDVRAAVTTRARHNLAALQLDRARLSQKMLSAPGGVEQVVDDVKGFDGQAITKGMADTLALQMREKLIADGLEAARDAVTILRDTVRDDPDATDAVHNLVLAQRVRRALELEQQNQQQTEQDDEGDENEGEEEDSAEGEQGDQGQPDDEGEEEQDPNAGEDDQQDGDQQSGQDGESTESEDESSQPQQGEPRNVGKEEAERMLERLLDAAAQKAREVEELKAARLRRGAVEKDW